jgi:hypothetical protein
LAWCGTSGHSGPTASAIETDTRRCRARHLTATGSGASPTRSSGQGIRRLCDERLNAETAPAGARDQATGGRHPSASARRCHGWSKASAMRRWRNAATRHRASQYRRGRPVADWYTGARHHSQTRDGMRTRLARFVTSFGNETFARAGDPRRAAQPRQPQPSRQATAQGSRNGNGTLDQGQGSRRTVRHRETSRPT